MSENSVWRRKRKKAVARQGIFALVQQGGSFVKAAIRIESSVSMAVSGGIVMLFFHVYNDSLLKKSYFKQRISLSMNMNYLLI